ncbi:hypothetical protein [Actinomadura harenae]|uniref:Cytotoxic translational repressor of toxin-antitoxin stability system n=1 Tax=Actinomadura harenae TaxID=2483351 RepID=A0A3M2M2I6_9ACTN|nr:hypothetical protein [Actinomadura harenae]RMI43310.1 hypothetical protein EBO15_16655 [Actinomadura harenae]
MSSLGEPFEVVFAAVAADLPGVLPVEGRKALGEALRQVAADPWAVTERYHPRMPAEMRTGVFGEDGVLVVVVSGRHHRVIVTHVTWMG